MYKAREKVYWFAIFSRIFIFVLQMLFNASCIDHKADAFITPLDPIEKYSFMDSIVEVIFGGLTRWDAQYYIHIARYGYTYENTLAFFPLFPMLIRYLGILLHLSKILNYNNSIVISGFVINFICFVKATLTLYDLTEVVFKNTKVAYRAAIFFSINPASIFFTAIYTESIFAYLTFYTMLESINNNPYIFLPLGLSSLVRSNGLVNIGFPIYFWIRNVLITYIRNFKLKCNHSNIRSLLFVLRHIFISISQIILLVILSFLPFSLLQIYNYAKFCKVESNVILLPLHIQQHALENHFLFPGKQSFSWCNATIPIAYSYIQSKYWNVGFLNYYKLKQIPNFLIAFPILFFMIKCCFEYFKDHKLKLCTLEFFTGVQKDSKTNKHRYPLEMFVFIVHGLFLTLFCIFVVHIQVSTRLLCSASPLLYWYSALLTLPKEDLYKNKKHLAYEYQENIFSRWKVFFFLQKQFTVSEKIILGYFLGYVIVGCFLYSNFLPWT